MIERTAERLALYYMLIHELNADKVALRMLSKMFARAPAWNISNLIIIGLGSAQPPVSQMTDSKRAVQVCAGMGIRAYTVAGFNCT